MQLVFFSELKIGGNLTNASTSRPKSTLSGLLTSYLAYLPPMSAVEAVLTEKSSYGQKIGSQLEVSLNWNCTC